MRESIERNRKVCGSQREKASENKRVEKVKYLENERRRRREQKSKR